MRRSSPRSLPIALAVLALGAPSWIAPPSVHGQDAPPQVAPADDTMKRLKELDGTIARRLDAGKFAAALPPAREKLDLLGRTRGKDYWQTGDARRDLETLQRLAAVPREVQDRYVKALQAGAR